ncbi:unnamed protein product, partial [Discosporangium mesarthrocarpum]
MPDSPRAMNGTEWGLLVLLSVLWGGAFFFAGVAVREVPPLTVVLVRVGLAAVLLLPVFWFYGHRLPRTLAGWMPFFVMGLLNNVLPFGLLFAAQTQITVGLTSIINAMTPLFTVLVMAAFGAERLTGNRIAGILLGVIGVAVLRGFDGHFDPAQTLGLGLGLLATLSYGFAALWGRRHLAGVAPLKSATCQLLCSTAVMLVVVALVDAPWRLAMPSLPVWLSLGALALFGTAVAYIVFFEILVRAGASNVMLVTLLIPVSGLLLGHAFLDEAIHLREVAGAAIIGLGLLAIDGRVLRWVRRLR